MNETILKMENISKRFGSVQALENVQFELKKGEVHALIGENGAGKSTFLNIMSGTYKPDAGNMYLNGKQVQFKTPLAAKEQGIVKVHQELQLIPEITVAQNMFLGNEIIGKFGTINFKEMEKRADAMLEKMYAGFHSNVITKTLSTAQQQMVEIAKALLHDFNVLALDEPTASLTNKEIDELFKIVKELRNQGKSIIYISHRLDELFEICDRATVFRDGKYIDTVNVNEIDKPQLVKMMVGRDIGNENYHIESTGKKEPILEVKNLSGNNNRFNNISFTLNKGEILGLAGLVGAGRTELVRGIFGADKLKEGKIYLEGKEVTIQCPKDAIDQGIMLIPEDRKLQGFVPGLTNTANVALSNLDRYKKYVVLNFSDMNRQVKTLTDQLDVHPTDNNLQTKQLSGGNQQKIVVAKALNVEPNILILDEPTRGIDVNAKHEIYELIRRLANAGKSIILISSELPEVLKLSDRILVMYEGKMTGELNGQEATENEIMRFAVGG
ncbi:MAG: sugar ABC transporter ATP-binding protein [Lachnospiraceae bacterium]|nr:sugar ABC transporter ATP-binding protein [Lachnospiraceae bacterium]MDD3794471.1 sugar ABC transporter ATP-binding protein [Lachnospiraceae bacterium]